MFNCKILFTCTILLFNIKFNKKERCNGSGNIHENNGLCAYGY